MAAVMFGDIFFHVWDLQKPFWVVVLKIFGIFTGEDEPFFYDHIFQIC